METRIVMPQLGESVVDGTVAEWLKREGDSVEEYESILRVSTDKVDTEIPSPAKGILRQILVQEGTTVNAGVLLGVIASENGSSVATSHAEPQAIVAQAPQPTTVSISANAHITPVVARMAQEHSLDLSKINGTGHGGRITKKDVMAFMEAKPTKTEELPPWEQPGSGDLFKPSVEYATSAPKLAVAEAPKAPTSPIVTTGIPHDLIAISNMRRRIADHMVESKHTSPHVTTVFEVDVSAITHHRNQHKTEYAAQGTKLTFTPYFVLAVTTALRKYPLLNARWTNDNILAYKVAHIGIATATDDGLLVPVIKNAQDYNLMGLARQINDLAERARSKQLRPDDIRDGTFTITNHGVSGSLFATPIINQPQSAILGVGIIEKRVKVINDAIAIRPCAYLSLTFDHRIADGATADGFMSEVKRILEDWA